MDINLMKIRERKVNEALLCLTLKRFCKTLDWFHRSSGDEIERLYDTAYKTKEIADFLAVYGSDEAQKILLNAINAALCLQNAQLAEKKARINDTACRRALKEFSRHHSEEYVKTLPAYKTFVEAKEEADKAFLKAVEDRKAEEEKFNAANEKLEKLLASFPTV